MGLSPGFCPERFPLVERELHLALLPHLRLLVTSLSQAYVRFAKPSFSLSFQKPFSPPQSFSSNKYTLAVRLVSSLQKTLGNTKQVVEHTLHKGCEVCSSLMLLSTCLALFPKSQGWSTQNALKLNNNDTHKKIIQGEKAC